MPVRNGLRDISVQELTADPLLVADTLERKLAGLPVDERKFPRLARQAQDALRLLRAVGSKRYGAISLLALVDILQAVDYLLVCQDQTCDSQEDGYADDEEKMSAAFARHEKELADFRLWFNRQG